MSGRVVAVGWLAVVADADVAGRRMAVYHRVPGHISFTFVMRKERIMFSSWLFSGSYTERIIRELMRMVGYWYHLLTPHTLRHGFQLSDTSPPPPPSTPTLYPLYSDWGYPSPDTYPSEFRPHPIDSVPIAHSIAHPPACTNRRNDITSVQSANVHPFQSYPHPLSHCWTHCTVLQTHYTHPCQTLCTTVYSKPIAHFCKHIYISMKSPLRKPHLSNCTYNAHRRKPLKPRCKQTP